MKTFANLKNIRIWLIMLFVFLGMDAMAQNITGTVKDHLGEPVIGASVLVERSDKKVYFKFLSN